MRMALKLQGYEVNIVYRPGRLNQNADGLSRQNYEEEDTSVRPGPGNSQLCQGGKSLAGGPGLTDKMRKESEDKETVVHRTFVCVCHYVLLLL